MISKITIKNTRRLHQKKYRQQHGIFLLEGEKSVEELLHSDLICEQIFATKEWCNNLNHNIAERARNINCVVAKDGVV